MRVTVVAVGSRGDVQPYVALARGLRCAGHDVTVATHGRFQSLVDQAGARLAPLRSDPKALLDTPAGQSWIDSARNPVAFFTRLRRLALDSGMRLSDDIADACRDAEAIVYSSLGTAAQHVAEAARVPAAVALPFPVTPTRQHPSVLLGVRSLGSLGNWASAWLAAALLDWPFRSAVNRWRRDRLGLPPVRGWNYYSSLDPRRYPALYAYSALVVPRPRDWGPGRWITGYWVLPTPATWQPERRLADFLAAGEPPVYIGFGSMRARNPQRLAAVVRTAVRSAGVRAVVARGWAELHVDDADDLLMVDDVPHEWLLRRCAAVVHHGGAGTTGAALRSGVPSMVAPFFADQFFWAGRSQALGVGPALPPAQRLDAETLAGALRAAARPHFRERAATLGGALAEEDGVARAVALLESSWASWTPARR